MERPVVDCRGCKRVTFAGDVYCCASCRRGSHTRACNEFNRAQAEAFCERTQLNLIAPPARKSTLAPLLERYRT